MAPAPTTRTRMGYSPCSSCVIARSEATKQSRVPPTTLDCFASLAMTVWSLARDHFLDIAQLFLAEKHFLADEEGRRAERAAFDGRLGVLDQFRLDVGILGTGEQLCSVGLGGDECLARDFRIVHLLRLYPHMMEGRVDIFLEYALHLGCDGGAH